MISARASYFSNRSQHRSVSSAFEPVLVPAVSTTFERTDAESSVDLQDPNGPPMRIHCIQKLCRDKRLDDIPGWFDRWDVFLGVNDLDASILSVPNDEEQAALRRRVWFKVVVHAALIAALLAVWVSVPSLTSLIKHTLTRVGHRVVLYGLLLVVLLLVKLTLDWPPIRRLLFLIYLVMLSMLLASLQIVTHHPAILYATTLAVVPQLVVLLLCGVQRRTNDGPAVFLHHVTVGCVAAVVTTIAVVATHFSSGLLEDSDRLALSVFGLVTISFLAAYEASLLFRTLAPDETKLGVYCVHFDIHVATLVIPTVLLVMVVGAVLGLAVGTPVEMLRQLYSSVWDRYSGGSTCGLVWHLHCWRRRPSRVRVATDTTSNGVSPPQETKEGD